MGFGLNDLGEELLVKDGFQTACEIGLYYDTDDTLDDDSDLASVTTEPSGNGYARQSKTITTADMSKLDGDWGFSFDVAFSSLSFPSEKFVDGWFMMVSFTAEETADGGDTDHLVMSGELNELRDLQYIETLDVTVEGTVD